MDITRIHLIPKPLEAVQYTEQDREAIRQWVQDHSTFTEIVLDRDNGRLYLPTERGASMEIVEYGEWILRDPDSNDFVSATHEAVSEHYETVED